MKALIIIVVILAVIIVSDVLSANFFAKEEDYYKAKIEKIKEAIENQDTEYAQQSIEAIHDHWDQRMPLWGILCDHMELEAIDILLHRLEQYPHPDYEEEAQNDLIEVLRLVIYTARRYRFEVQNIF